MFEITNAEKLRDSYTLLAFIRDDVPTTTAEQKSGLAAFMVSIKKEIRAYNNRPAPDSRIVEERGIDGYIELVRLPDELDKVNEDDAAEWFRANRYYEFYPTPYDCSGQRFTNWYKLHRRCGHWFAHIIRSALTFNQIGGLNREAAGSVERDRGRHPDLDLH